MIHIKSVPSKDQNQYIIMLIFGEVKVAKENFYGSKQSINIWDINIDNNFIWKLGWGQLLEKCKTIWNNIEDLQNIELNPLTVYDNRYTKSKVRTYVYKDTNSCGLNVPEDDIVCGPLTVISIGSLPIYENKYYLQVYLGNFAYKIVDEWMMNYLSENSFQTDED